MDGAQARVDGGNGERLGKAEEQVAQPRLVQAARRRQRQAPQNARRRRGLGVERDGAFVHAGRALLPAAVRSASLGIVSSAARMDKRRPRGPSAPIYGLLPACERRQSGSAPAAPRHRGYGSRRRRYSVLAAARDGGTGGRRSCWRRMPTRVSTCARHSLSRARRGQFRRPSSTLTPLR